jgi:hypothetical protein
MVSSHSLTKRNLISCRFLSPGNQKKEKTR